MDRINRLSRIPLISEYPTGERWKIYLRLLKVVIFIALINIVIGVAYYAVVLAVRVMNIYSLGFLVIGLIIFLTTLTITLGTSYRRVPPPLVVVYQEQRPDDYHMSCLPFIFFFGIFLLILFVLLVY